MRDIETVDTELRFVAALRRVARERGVPRPSITFWCSPTPLCFNGSRMVVVDGTPCAGAEVAMIFKNVPHAQKRHNDSLTV
jgi:hypothetical protein